MALRFQKRIRIASGVKVNLSANGISLTVGPKGASVNVEKKGTYANLGIPGTGLSTRTKLSKKRLPTEYAQSAEPKTKGASNSLLPIVIVLGVLAFAWLMLS